MANDPAALKGLIETELTAQGFALDNEFCFASKMATAIANAVTTHISGVNAVGSDSHGDSHNLALV